MKWRRFVFPVVLLMIVIFILWGSSIGKADLGQQFDIPEVPPLPSEGFDPEPFPTTPPLAKELTEREALEKAFYFDSLGVEWVKPWSPDKLDEDPGRITVTLYESRSEAAKASGRDIWYDPDLEADAGRVWVISIDGLANPSVLMSNVAEDEMVTRVTYEISARTGELLAMRTNLQTEK